MQDNLDVVDHQVENDPDIGASVGIRREASDFEKPWVVEFAFQRGEDDLLVPERGDQPRVDEDLRETAGY